jgi:comEA protein
MFSLTSYERKVLIFIGALILCGAALKFFNVGFISQKTTVKTTPNETTPKIPNNISNPNVLTKQIIVNVNTASQQELEKIPGIGPELARRLIAYRQTKGQFRDLEDLKDVKGIGEKKAQLIKNYISF